MNKKKFPRAVTQTADQMREAGASATAMSAPDNIIAMMPKLDSANAASQPDATPADPAAALRRRNATAIVERYANYSSIGGAIPVPFANAAAIAALMIKMVKSLSQLYGVPFNRSRTRVVVIALASDGIFHHRDNHHLVYSRAQSVRACSFVRDFRGLCPLHRTAVHRALRERFTG